MKTYSNVLGVKGQDRSWPFCLSEACLWIFIQHFTHFPVSYADYFIFSEMLLQRPINMNNLGLSNILSREETSYMRDMAVNHFDKVMQVLKSMPRPMLLVFRNINTVRSINISLGAPVDRYCVMAKRWAFASSIHFMDTSTFKLLCFLSSNGNRDLRSRFGSLTGDVKFSINIGNRSLLLLCCQCRARLGETSSWEAGDSASTLGVQLESQCLGELQIWVCLEVRRYKLDVLHQGQCRPVITGSSRWMMTMMVCLPRSEMAMMSLTRSLLTLLSYLGLVKLNEEVYQYLR